MGCRLILTLERELGEKSQHVAFELGREYAYVPGRSAIDLGGIPIASFEDTVEVMRKRKLTTDMIRKAATQLGAMLADRLEDEGGWHGERRQEAAEKASKY